MQPDAHDFLVGPAQRQVQEPQRIKQRLGRVPEGFQQGLEGDFGSPRAFGMAAHAIDHYQQGGMLGHGHRDPVLVLLATPEKT